jgi:hypothetical protein
VYQLRNTSMSAFKDLAKLIESCGPDCGQDPDKCTDDDGKDPTRPKSTKNRLSDLDEPEEFAG